VSAGGGGWSLRLVNSSGTAGALPLPTFGFSTGGGLFKLAAPVVSRSQLPKLEQLSALSSGGVNVATAGAV